ncbi:TPA: tail assembly protein, partial [Pseudomonas aeruginosa]
MTIAAHHTPMTTIKLYGALRQFGWEYRMLVGSTAEAIKALCVQIPGLERFLAN